MKKVLRILLIIFAIGFGGFLGYVLLPGFDLLKMCVFGVACAILGVVFHLIDKRLNE